MVRQLGQGLGASNTDADRNASATQHLAANASAELVQVSNTGQIGKRFIDAVDLDRWNHGFDQGHDPLAHVPVQGVVRGERHDAMLLELVFDLEVRLTHLHEGLRVVAARNDTAVVVAQHDNRHLGQVRAKHPLARCVERVAIDQCKHGRFRHGCARCR